MRKGKLELGCLRVKRMTRIMTNFSLFSPSEVCMLIGKDVREKKLNKYLPTKDIKGSKEKVIK